MKNHTRLMVTVGMIVLVVVLVMGSVQQVSAQGPDGGRRGPRARLVQAVLTAVKDVTGLDNAAIRTQLRDGKTLTEIVSENGGDPQAVTDAAKAQLTQEIDQALSDGKITTDQAENARNNLDSALDIAMNSTMPHRGDRQHPIRDRIQNRVEQSLVGTIASLAGVDPQDIVQEWRSGSTLAEIVEAHGLAVDAVLTEAEARFTDEVNQAVANGNLTQPQADRLLNTLHDRLERRLNAQRPQRPLNV